jgi:hypothetical protein
MTGSPALRLPAPHRWATFAAFWLALSLMAAMWAVAMPLATGPDEPEHFVKAASVARGQLAGPRSDAGYVVQVPEYVAAAHTQLCTAFEPETTADCSPAIPAASGLVDGTTTAGSYNPVYYAAVGWPTLFLGDASGLYAMRIASGVLVSAFLALAFMMMSAWTRRSLPVLGLMVAITPMVGYLGGVVNPNSLEIAATAAVLVAMLSVAIRPDPRLLTERAVILAVSAAVASNMRGISPLWVAIAVLAPLVLMPRASRRLMLRQRPVLISAGVVVVTALCSVLWTLLASSLSQGTAVAPPGATSTDTDYDNVGSSPVFGFVKMVGLTFDFIQDIIGRMGWYDTVLPIGTYLVWASLLGALAIASFALLRRRRAAFAAVLLLAFIVGPAIVQAAYITQGGFIWQARYTLPIFVCLCVGLAVAVNETVTFSPRYVLRRLAILVFALWSVNQVAAFLQALRRYTVGESGSYTVMAVAVLSIAVVGALILRLALARDEHLEPSPVAPPETRKPALSEEPLK